MAKIDRLLTSQLNDENCRTMEEGDVPRDTAFTIWQVERAR